MENMLERQAGGDGFQDRFFSLEQEVCPFLDGTANFPDERVRRRLDRGQAIML